MFLRSDKSLIAKWWWNIDGFILFCVMTLCVLGVVLLLSASPSVAERIGVGPYYFVKKHLMFLPISLGVIFLTSLLNNRQIRLLSLLVFAGSIFLMLLVLFMGQEIKGATRWINIFGISIQPSEFMKPAFAVMVGWAFSYGCMRPDFPGVKIAIGFYLAVVSLLVLQPDIGMTIIISLTWGAQFFVAGLSLAFVGILIGGAVLFMVIAYFTFSHVRTRIDTFLNPESGDTYQVTSAIKAFSNGSFFGRGPGEGSVKATVPDVHTDFILTVAAEEFGFIMCLLIVAIYCFVVVYSLYRVASNNNLFAIITVAGLCAQLGFQALVNISSTISLIPTKGMTLPFISYGGSSLVAVSFGIGIILALTKKTKEV